MTTTLTRLTVRPEVDRARRTLALAREHLAGASEQGLVDYVESNERTAAEWYRRADDAEHYGDTEYADELVGDARRAECRAAAGRVVTLERAANAATSVFSRALLADAAGEAGRALDDLARTLPA